jgi:hypothetical protein
MLVAVGGFIVFGLGMARRTYRCTLLCCVRDPRSGYRMDSFMESFDRPRVARKLIAVHRRGALPFL